MAVRVHVVAAHGVTKKKFKEAFAELGNLTPNKSGKWVWLTASVWGVAGSTLDAALRKLAVPSLRATTEDGVRWWLHLFAEGRETFTRCHDFTLLRPAEIAEAYGGKFDRFARDQNIPKETRKMLKDMSCEEAIQWWLREQAEDIDDALHDVGAGIPHNCEEVRAVLTGETVTDEELGWDVGNLPRFLTCLGLGDVFAGWQDALSDEAIEDEDMEEKPPPDLVTPIFRRVRDIKPVLVEGGAVALPLNALPHVWCLAWFCDTDVDVGVGIQLPKGAQFEADWSGIENLHVKERKNGWRLALAWGPIGWMRRGLSQIAQRLKEIPDENQLELVCSNEEEECTAGNQRYRGTVRSGQWHIEKTFPAVTAQVLSDALALAAQIEKKTPMKAHSEEEAEAVVQAASRSDWFDNETQPQRIGREVRVQRDRRAHLAMMFFRQRFRDTWNVSESEADDEESRTEWDDAMAQLDTQLRERFGAPTTDEVIYTGRKAVFRRSDMSKVAQSNPLQGLTAIFERLYEDSMKDEKITEQPDPVAETDVGMKAVGLEVLGDMVCDKFYDVVIRGYGAEGSDTYGVLMRSGFGDFYMDFVTNFEDGTSLTTTTTPGVKDIAKKKMHRRSYADKGVESLHAQHRKRVAEFVAKGLVPKPAPASLEAMAKAMDEFLVRYES